jgi:hypothetical protein
MKNIYITLIIGLLAVQLVSAQTIWEGETLIFTKPSGSDWTLEANQDRITDNVWLTRANNQGIFNIGQEEDYATESSPLDTEWSFGTTGEIATLTFADWETAVNALPLQMLNQDMVLHLLTDDIYIDLKFTSWFSGQGQGGGGFTYERSTDPSLSARNTEAEQRVSLFPNPSSGYIQVSGIEGVEQYAVFNLLGQEMQNGFVTEMGQIDLNELQKGLYFLRIGNGLTSRFVRN